MEAVRSIRITASSVVYMKPCRIVSISLNVSTDAKGCVLYDQRSPVTTGQLLEIDGLASETKLMSFPHGRKFDVGIYAVLDTECSEVTIDLIDEQSLRCRDEVND